MNAHSPRQPGLRAVTQKRGATQYYSMTEMYVVGSSGAPRASGFAMASIMMLLPMIAGVVATLVVSWGGFIETAFMDMTLSLEGFDYKFGPAKCNGEWKECGNATFDVYVQSRNLSIMLFILALVFVAIKDMLSAGFDGNISMDVADNKSLPELLKYSVLVFVVLFIFPPIWDVAAGTMNNVGVWILNPHYNIAGSGGSYTPGQTQDAMCTGIITFEDLAALAPVVRNADEWAVYQNGDAGPLDNGATVPHRFATNMIIQKGEVLSNQCLNQGMDCPSTISNRPPDKQLGDILCNPDLRVKYVFQQALSVTETEPANAEEILGSVTGNIGDDILVGIFTQFLKGSVTIQVIMVTFMVGVMVDVVTAFALAILPVVFFYRFLPMSGKIKLGDYSGAAFALLAMPMIASIILVAGSGAVAVMAAEHQDFASFFVWLAALSVVLLVIGIPSTMVPLIGAATAQATAAVQTGVQTAQFAVTAAGAAASGAIRGRAQYRAGMGDYAGLKGMDRSKMSAAQVARLDQLKKEGHGGRFGAARAAFGGASGGLRGEIYDDKGQFRKEFRNVGMPDTGKLQEGSLRGLGMNVDSGALRDSAALTTTAMQASQAVGQSAIQQASDAKWDKEKEAAKRQEEARQAEGRVKTSQHMQDTTHQVVREAYESDDRTKTLVQQSEVIDGHKARLEGAQKNDKNLIRGWQRAVGEHAEVKGQHEAAWGEVKPEDAAAYRNLKDDVAVRESRIAQMGAEHKAEMEQMKDEGASLGDIALRQEDMSAQIENLRTEHANTQGELKTMLRENENLGKAAGLDDSLAQSEEAMEKAKKTMDNNQANIAKLNGMLGEQRAEYGRSLHYMAGMAGALSPQVANAVLSERATWDALQEAEADYNTKSLVSEYTREGVILDQGANQPGESKNKEGDKPKRRFVQR